MLSLSLGLSSVTSVMPVEFEYNQSTEQAFYFIIDASIDGMPIEEGDWIAAFKGDLCVGARQWIGSYTDIPVMGDDGEEYSVGYMLPGEYPSFKIYKLSESIIYNAQPSQNVGFPQGLLAFFEIQSLDVIYDCANVLGGLSVVDNCGVCDDDPSNDCANDCMGIWGGDAYIDECGVCSGGTSNHEANSDKDDCGVCFGNNGNDQGCGCFLPPAEEYWFDEDGDGLGAGESQEYCYADLPAYWVDNNIDPEPNCSNPDANTFMIDECGVCAGGGVNDLGCGCFNPAALEYWFDSDGDSLGSGDSEFYCLQDLPENWVLNNDDLESDCSTNDTDYCGICAGGGLDDLGCGCFKPAAIKYWYDVDLDGFGFGDSEEFCLQDIPENWVPNNVDLEEFCWNPDPVTPMIDECGVCAGGGLDDVGCGCFNPAPLEYWYDTDEDGMGFGDSEEFCLQNIPDNWVSNNDDPEPYCSTNDIDHCGVCAGGGEDDLGCGCYNPAALDYWYDSDGDNLGSGDSIEFCADDVLENWVPNGNDQYPSCFDNFYDHCDVCGGDGSDDLGCGCYNPAALEYWYDSDGDGLGSGDSEFYCEADIPENWVPNNNDLEPECATNDTDYCGICAGGGVDDVGCGCFNPAALEYWYDSDGDGLGSGDSEFYCLQDVTNEWVLNNDDIEPDCATNDTDHCGVCAGGGVDDLGCGCFEIAPAEYCEDTDGDGLGNAGGNGDTGPSCNSDISTWSINQADFQFNGSVTSKVYIDDVEVGSSGDMVAAYVGDEVRGVVNGLALPPFLGGGYSFNIMIYSNQGSGEEITFKYYAAGSEEVICLNESLEFVSDMVVGNAVSPFVLTGTSSGGSGDGRVLYCEDEVPDNWVADCSDPEPDCSSNDTDDCDVCGGDNNDMDCEGNCFGDAVFDNCGECDDNPDNDCNVDCHGDWGGVAYFDDCGQCSGGNSGHSANSDIDDCGDCFGNNEANLGCGCDIAGPQNYWFDSDGDGLGSGDYELYCEGSEPFGWINNENDTEPNCSTNDTDECGICAGSGSTCASPSNIIAIGGRNEVHITWDVNSEASFYNIYYFEDGLIGTTNEFTFTDPPEAGFGLSYDTEYCYVITSVNSLGIEGAQSSPICATTLPYVLTALDLQVDAQAGIIDVYLTNLWTVTGYQFDINFDPEYLDVVDVTGLLNPFYGNGTILGYSITGELIESNPEGALLVSIQLEPTQNNFDELFNVFLSDIVISDENSEGLVACDMDFDVSNGCDISSQFNFAVDCNDDWFGTALLDDCSECSEGNSGHIANSDIDCNGECFGSAFVDDCNDCVEGSTGLEENYANQGCGCDIPAPMTYCEDTDDDNFGNPGTETEFCMADTPDDWVLNCSDPEPDCSTNNTDHCGECGGGGQSDLGCGCHKPGPETFYFDSDNDNLGSGEPSEFCFGEQPDGWVQNSDDEYPDCFYNYFDECEICGGDGIDNAGCGCFEPAALIYCEDTDFDGLGTPGTETEFCLDLLPSGWVSDCSDPEPECATNDTDHCGECAGGGQSDLGCGCFELAPIEYCYDSDGDGLGAGSFVEYCAVDVPENWVADCSDLEPFCLTNDTDDCDVCGGDNSSCTGCTDENAWNYCVDCTIDDESCIFTPDEFHFSQSTSQAFYFVIEADISEISLNENEDWIGTFKGDVCVGARPWEGTFTSVPAMGNDGSEWTNGYLVEGDYPTFKIFDASENAYFETEAININILEQFSSRDYDGWTNFGFYEIDRLRALLPDCANVLDGNAYVDGCGECVGGSTGLAEGWAEDCNGDCFGAAYFDNCGICSEGNSEHTANIDDAGCGCFELAAENYWYDADGDSLGSGDPVSLCQDDVSEVWVQNDDDTEPFCASNDTDDCGVCAGNNADMDCAGICFGVTLIDECGECGGDGTSCLAPVANAQSVELFEDAPSSITLSASDPNGYPITEYTIITSPLNGSLYGVAPNFTYTPNLNFNGEDSFTFTVSTNQYTSEPSIVSLSIIPVNDVPTAYDIQKNFDEDQSIEFQLIGFDIDGDELSFEIVSGPYEGEAFIIGDMVSYTPNQNYFGIDSFDFIANDGEVNSNIVTASLIVQGVNDLPDVELIPNLEILEDESLSININATDVEDDYLVYSATVDNNASLTVEGSLITVTPDENYYGELLVSVNVTDGFGVASEEFSIDVISVNDAPLIETVPSQIMDEDESISINLIASDIDGDELVLSASPSDFASFSFIESELTITPIENYYGQFTADIFVSDGEYMDSTSLTVTVNSINDAPVLTYIGAQSGVEDEAFNIELIASDIENDEITFSASADGNSQVSIENNSLIVIPTENYYGDINISVIATDGSATDSESFVLSINPVNDAPAISIINDIIIDEDNSVSFRITARDIDNDSLSYFASGSDVFFEYNDDLVTIIPNENLSGIVQVTAFVSDGEYDVSTTFDLIINEINDAPSIISEIENFELNQNGEDFIIDLTNHFYDVENGDDLEYSIFENHPAIITTVEDNNLSLSIIENVIGSGFITITASDNIDRAVASINFEVIVIAVNQPPVVNDMYLPTDEDLELVFTLDATDESSDLLVSILSGPSNGVISDITGIDLTYIPFENYFGSDHVIVSISDGELSSELTVELEINPINDAPHFITNSLEDVVELSDFSQLIEYDDIDNEYGDIIISLVMGPSWLTLEGNYLEGLPLGADAGIYTIMLQVDDGSDASSIDLDLVVINLNEAPIASDLSVTCEEDASISFSIFASDNDGDELSYSLEDAENGSVSGTPPNLVYTPNSNFSGDDFITFTAFDGSEYSNEGVVYINVLPVNDSPISNDAIFEVSGSEYEFDLSDYVTDLENDDLSFVSIPPSDSDTLQTVFGGLVIPQGNNLFIYEHPEGISDADFLLYKVNDGLAESAASMITFNLYGRSWSRNNPPSAFDDEIYMLEDNTAQVTLIGFDVFNQFPQDGSESISITQSPTFGSLGDIEFVAGNATQLAQWIVNYTPVNNFSGIDEIRFMVHNPNNENGESEEGIISINISSVNDLPTFSNIESINFNEDENSVIEIQFSDVDSDLILDVEDNEFIDVQITSNNASSAQLYITASENYFGSSTISISVSEDHENGIEITQSVAVIVDAVNDSPVLNNISDIIINEDESSTIQLDATDIDFVSFGFDISTSENVTTELLGNQFTLIPSENWYGEESFTITVQDNLGLQDSQTFNVSVLSVNDAPIANDQSHDLIEDGVKLIYPSGSDIEDNQLTFAIFEQPEHGSVTVDGWVFRYEPDENYYGDDTFSYVANDGIDISDPAIVTLTVSAINDAPIFSDVEPIELDEDTDTDILLSAIDIDGDLLNFSIVNAESEIGATVVANVLSISPDANYFGTGSIILKVSDGEYQEMQSVNVNVLAVNDSPIIDEINDIILDEGAGTEIELTAFDIDNDTLTFLTYSDDTVELSILGTTLTVLTDANAGDSEIVINVIVSDNEDTDTETFSVFTQNLNDAPSTQSLSFELNEDSQLSLAPQGSDPDGDELSFSLVSLPENGSLESNNGLFIYTPNNDFVGTDYFTYLANDGEYDSDVSTVNITINNVNDQPALMAIDDRLIEEGQSIEIELNADDIDGDALTYSAITDGDVVVDILGNILTISPLDENFNGDIGVLVSVSDGQLEDSYSFILSYLPINDVPQISLIPNVNILEDAAFVYLVDAFDLDGDDIIFSVEVDDNAIASIQGNLLTITPNQNYNGEINATVSVSDEEYTVFSSFSIQVLPVNDAPIIPAIVGQIALEDVEFQFNIEVEDIDNDNHTFSVSMDTTFVSYQLNGNSITIQPMGDWYGEILVSVSASDGEYTATQSFNIEFESVNDSPIIISSPISDATEDLLYEYQLEIDDPDNSSFFYTLIAAPDGMEISENGVVTWLPTEGIMSSGLIAIVVWDTETPNPGQDFPAYQEFIVQVESVNDAPIITSTPIITAIEDEEYSYQVTATDIDSDYFSYSLAVAPEGMTISNSGLIEWLPTEGILSSEMILVNVSDNDDVNPITVSQQYLVVVTPVNDAPIIVSLADSSATTGEEYSYQVIVEDPDDDEFTYILFNNPDEMRVDENGLVSWIPELPGVYGPITLAVSDGGENYVQPVQELFIVVVEAASPLITMDFELLHEANLISFLGIPEDSSVADIFGPLGANAQGLIGQGVASNNLGNGDWVGSLYNVEPTSGYWLKLNFPPIESFIVEAYPTNPNQNYELIEGQNIISYVGNDGMAISEAIPDEYENSFYGIIGQGSATIQLTEGEWVGSLTQLNNLKGYWVQVDEDMDFNWNVPEDLVRESTPILPIQKSVPSEFMYAQSTQQAFYFVEDANIDGYDLLEDDWLIAYHDDTVIGARQWNGQFTDVPTMGVDGFDDTFGYIESGMIPEFKLFRESTGELIELTGEEISPWRNNEMTFISLSRKEEIPNNVALNPAYPNPFNPSTQISFDIVVEGFVNLSVYDINGRLLEELKNDVVSVGSHSLIWNAQSYASGIYFLQLTAEDMSLSQKLILVK